MGCHNIPIAYLINHSRRGFEENQMIFNNAELYNIDELSFDITLNEYSMSRIPSSLASRLNPYVQKRALSPAGGEIRFNLYGDEAKIILRYKEDRGSDWVGAPVIAESYQGCFRTCWYTLGEKATEIFLRKPDNLTKLNRITESGKLPYDANLIRLILPYVPAIKLIGIEGDISVPLLRQTPAVKYLAYGSSITNGAFALAPMSSYVMKTASYLGVDPINLGFGGGAQLETEMADYIAGRKDWDFASLEMGINILYMDNNEFEKRVDYFIRKISTEHPNKWLFCIDIFTFEQDFEEKSQKAKFFRNIVKRVVRDIDMPRVIYIDGRALLKKASGLSRDLVHPSDAGFDDIATNLAYIINSHMKNNDT